LRRCTRVFFSNLRCFFFAMRLRRFLMTEPTVDLPNLRERRQSLPATAVRHLSEVVGGL
jgi:hypothetical protein